MRTTRIPPFMARRDAGGMPVLRAPRGSDWLGGYTRFVRITTNRRVVARPWSVREVMEHLHNWLTLPHVHVAQPSSSHFERLRSELERLGAAGNLTTDAHLAVLAMERRYVLYSTDADFARFVGLRWINPCR